MKSAALHLIRHNALIKETADYFGYADPYHFSKSFKRIHGLSPENYLRVPARRKSLEGWEPGPGVAAGPAAK
jgi:AraC-like DNA-binding protein